MLNKAVANVAIALAQSLEKAGLKLVAQPGTPVHALVQTTRLALSDIQGLKEYSPNAQLLAEQTTALGVGSEDAPSAHAIQLQTLGSQIGQQLARQLNFMRNVVRPVIQHVKDEFEAAVAGEPLNYEFNPEVVLWDLPEPMQQASLHDAISAFQHGNYYPYVGLLRLPERNSLELRELLSTGQDSLDGAVAQWLTRQGDGFVQRVWQAVFMSQGADNYNRLVEDPAQGVDVALLCYLLALKLYDNPPDGVGLGLNEYNEYIAQIRNLSALRLVHAYEDFERKRTLGQLVLSSTPGRIVVLAPVYKSWLEQGGSVAALCGAVLAPRQVLYAGDALEKLSELVDVWQRHNALHNITYANRRHTRYAQLLHSTVMRVVAARLQACFGTLSKNGEVSMGSPEVLTFEKSLDAFISRLGDADYKEPWVLARRLVCECIFHYTDAACFFQWVDEAIALNPQLHPREAALLATLQYATHYATDQLSLVNL